MSSIVGKSEYGHVAGIYDGFLTVTGFKKGMENFLDRVPFNFENGDRVLDAGTGTGLVAIYLAKKYPNIEIYATDLDLKMLREGMVLAKKEGLKNIRFFQNDLNFPRQLDDFVSGEKLSVSDGYFKIIITSGVLEHVDIQKVIPHLAEIMQDNGVLLNIGVKKNPMVSVFEMMYKFKPNSIEEILQLCRTSGLAGAHVINFQASDFPANLSRIAVLARKV